MDVPNDLKQSMKKSASLSIPEKQAAAQKRNQPRPAAAPPLSQPGTNPSESFKKAAEKKDDPKKKEKTDAQDWLERAAEAKLSREKATLILDEIIEKGRYTETFPMRKNISLTLQTRLGSDRRRVNDAINLYNPKTPEALMDLYFVYNAAASILHFGETTLSHETEDDIRNNMKWLDTLPEPILQFISHKLAEFDQQVGLASEKMGVQNF